MLDSSTCSGGEARTVLKTALCFGHRNLAMTPGGIFEDQPLQAEGLLLTGDIRLDNRAELVNVLETDPNASDEHILLLAYRQWGAFCPDHVLGDFAFAIWDETSQTLFCARDPMGMKPFFYMATPSVFAFASEIRPLRSLGLNQPRLRRTMVRDYLLALPGDADATMYEEISKLPPASTLTLARGKQPVLRQYWRLDPFRELPARTDADYLEMFRSVFEEAVRCRLRTASPLGATLSGGLDSSAVVCVARDLLRGCAPLHTFSLRFPATPECDEGRFIESVREQGGLVAHDVPGDERSPLQEFLSTLDHFDEPCLVPNVHLTGMLFRAVRAHGVRVLLDGHDGDTAISHGDVPQSGRHALERTFLRLARSTLQPMETLRRLRKRLERRSRDRVAPHGILNKAFAVQTGAVERAAGSVRAREEAERAGGRLRHVYLLDSGFPNYASEMLERAGTTFGVEPRHPFYDIRVLEFCLAMPPALKRRDGLSRYVLRGALDALPAAVRWRPDKTDLTPQFNRAFETVDRDRLDSVIRGDQELLAPFVDIPKLRECHRLFLETRGSEVSIQLWTAVTLAFWLRRSGASP